MIQTPIIDFKLVQTLVYNKTRDLNIREFEEEVLKYLQDDYYMSGGVTITPHPKLADVSIYMVAMDKQRLII